MKQTINQIPEELQALPEEIKQEMVEVRREDIFQLRLTGKRFIVIKTSEKIYIIPYKAGMDVKKEEKDVTTIEKVRYVFGSHLCGGCANFYNESTKRLCPKVADGSSDACKRYCGSPVDAVMEAKRMEKYPFIKMGVEQVNASDDFFVVARCENFQKSTRAVKEENREMEREVWRQRAEAARQESEERRRRALEGEQYYNFGFKPW